MRIVRLSLVAAMLSFAHLASPAAAQDAMALAKAVVATEDRSDADRALDAGRKPAELLAALGVQRGWVIADLGAGGGYTTELLQRAVGEAGLVYGQNSKALLEKAFEKPWSARLAKPVMRNVVRVDRDFDDPFPPDIRPLDAVTLILFYHDTVWLGVDRVAMNKAVLNALKPGGYYFIVDHSARLGDGTSVTNTLHRIEESAVIAEVQAAGFELVDSPGFLHNPDDMRDWNDSGRAAGERRGTSDRFVLRFRKP